GEVLQTETAAVSRSITGRQINETPIASRDALDLVTLMPGTNSVGAPRRSSINGLPKGALSITIDGVDVQDNLLRSADGFFTYVRPRVDAIDEVTISTSNPGADASGDGAVQIKFVTKRGTNDYRGGLFYQHRDESLNANYWYQNRDGALDSNGKAFRQKIRLNQYGVHMGGPIPFFNFGEGVKPFDNGKDKRFFFVNYEEFRLPEAQARTRLVLTPAAQAGTYTYLVGNTQQTINVYNVAAAYAGDCDANTPGVQPCPSTPDATVGTLLTQIRSAVNSQGTLTPASNVNTQFYNFTPKGGQVRKFLALRFDANINKKNSAEFIINRQHFVPSKDFLNSQDERFPGFPSYTQGSQRNAYSFAVRSTLTERLVNEGRVAISTGVSSFSDGISPLDFANQGGYALGINAAFGITSATARNSYSDRNTPTYDFTDSLSWVRGNHTFGFGGQYKLIKSFSNAIGQIVPIVSFGIDQTVVGDPAMNAFSAAALPGLTQTQRNEAMALYATLTGRVLGYTSTAYLTSDGTYKINALQSQSSKQTTYGLYGQDSWKIRPNLTLNYGLRWQPQGGFIVESANYARIEDFNQVYGLSGPGNMFMPGTMTGTVPRVVGLKPGENIYPNDYNNFAPTVGVVWSPNFKGGIGRYIFGDADKSVFRGGYSRSFVREGFALIGSLLGANPGGTLDASRTLGFGNLQVGTLLRTPGNPNLTPSSTIPVSPSYPFAITSVSPSEDINAFDPKLHTGYVDSFSLGYQRELDKNSVIEVRYVGNRGRDLMRQHNINEVNTIENGFAADFVRAQSNLYLNLAAGKGATFAYRTDVPGSQQLPVILSYINPSSTYDPSNPARYNSTLFTNPTLLGTLNQNAPNAISFTSLLENSLGRRANAASNGRPANFVYVNPSSNTGGSYVLDNTAHSWYDSLQVEFRRRLAQGIRVQASYVFGKALTDSYQSNTDNFANFTMRPNGLKLAKTYAVFDIRHALKFDGTFDLPFGRGRQFFSNAGRFVDYAIGGWSILPTFRWQSGSPIQIGNVQLVGMTVKDLEKAVGVYKNTVDTQLGQTNRVVTWLPYDIINNSRRAFDTNPLTGGYNNTYGGAPTGAFIAPAGYGNCIQRYATECGFNNLVIHGPSFFKFDVTVLKRFKITETANIELRATALDALNRPNFRVGGWNTDVNTSGCCGASFGQLPFGSAYQDISTTNDNGGRQIDLMIRVNW
ncbi:MAG: TonB-dependent receptor, partial [Acidobacteria bacterium]|nr:TonB-dependent receptor [Acidobacteriota bacterium]